VKWRIILSYSFENDLEGENESEKQHEYEDDDKLTNSGGINDETNEQKDIEIPTLISPSHSVQVVKSSCLCPDRYNFSFSTSPRKPVLPAIEEIERVEEKKRSSERQCSFQFIGTILLCSNAFIRFHWCVFSVGSPQLFT